MSAICWTFDEACSCRPYCHRDQILVIFTKNFGHMTNSKCHRDQILVIFTKNWSIVFPGTVALINSRFAEESFDGTYCRPVARGCEGCVRTPHRKKGPLFFFSKKTSFKKNFFFFKKFVFSKKKRHSKKTHSPGKIPGYGPVAHLHCRVPKGYGASLTGA